MIPKMVQEQQQQEQTLGQGDYESFYLAFPNDKEQLALMSSRTKRPRVTKALETQQEEQGERCIEETIHVNILYIRHCFTAFSIILYK